MPHVDEWLDMPAANDAERMAKTFLEHARRPAIEKDHKWLAEHPLFCTYQGVRFRCTGASRLGDAWLADDFKREFGYDLRVEVTECSEWSETPEVK